MRTIGYVLIFFIVWFILAWFPIGALCSLSSLRFSNACGHNAVYWFIFTLPIGFLISLFGTLKLVSKHRRSSK